MPYQHIWPRTIRFLSPAAGFSSLRQVRKALRELSMPAKSDPEAIDAAAYPIIKARLENNLCTLLSAKKAFVTGSGKEALYRLFCALKGGSGRDVVLMSAYTCPDIAVAAVRAGLLIYPVDIDPNTLEMNPSAVHVDRSRVLAVVLSNLYGLADSLEPWLKFAVDSGCDLIDDACQSALSEVEGTSIGARTGTYGVLSFGRGKALCGIGGGAVLFNGSYEPEVLERYTVTLPLPQKAFPSVPRQLVDLLKVSFAYTFSNPFFYWILACMPFLSFGKTRCDLDWHLQTVSQSTLGSIWAQLLKRKQKQINYFSAAKRYERLFSEMKGIGQPFTQRETRAREVIVPTRYPVLLPSAKIRNAVLPKLIGRGLGASASYPCPLTGFRQLLPKLLEVDCFVATDISSRIITLPVHQFVREKDMQEAVRLIEEEIRRSA